jgi:AraC family transcriptional regulator
MMNNSENKDQRRCDVKNSTSAGEPIRASELPGFMLTERVHSPDWVLSPHAHDATIIGVTWAGSFQEVVGRRRHDCEPGSLQILAAGEPHAYRFGSSQVHCLTIEVKSNKRAEIGLFSDILDQSRYFSGGELTSLLLRLHREFRAGDSVAALTIEGLVLETLGTAARRMTRGQSSAQPVWLRRARDFIHERFAEGVSLTELAMSVEIHPSHLTRMFRRHYGCSVGDYVRRCRLEYAAHELIASDQTLAEVAAAAGFYDQSHFTNVFKAHLKMTPAEYRAMARGSRR